MYICLCKGITENQVKNAIAHGCCNQLMLRRKLGIGSVCGECVQDIQGLLVEAACCRGTGVVPVSRKN